MVTKTKQTKLTDTKKLKIRNDFVHGIESEEKKLFPTLDELCKKYKVAKSTVYRVARSEGWKVQKEQLQTEYLKQLDKKRSKDMAEKSLKTDDRTLQLADAVFVTIAQTLQMNNNDLQKNKKGLAPNQITALAQAISITQKVSKLALGEATLNIDATVNENTNKAFREAMELLDEVENSRVRSIQSTH
jgi:DNA-binding MurR/RpiR family transcriptional regulator